MDTQSVVTTCKNARSNMDIYAMRLGRFCFLQHYCYKGHPVYNTEIHLLEMAKDKLRAELLSKYEIHELNQLRTTIETAIKNAAKSSILCRFTDMVECQVINTLIDNRDLQELFVVIN